MGQIMQRQSATKKASFIAFLAALLFTITACGSSEPVEQTYTKEENGVSVSLTYFAEGDEVTRQIASNEMPYSALGVETAEEAEELMGPLMEQFQDVEGLEHSVEYGEESATETLEVDFANADLETISQLTGSSFTDEVDDDTAISLEQTEEMLLQQGYTKEEN